MLKRLLANIFIHVYRVLFVAVFGAVNLAGIAFLAIIGYYLLF